MRRKRKKVKVKRMNKMKFLVVVVLVSSILAGICIWRTSRIPEYCFEKGCKIKSGLFRERVGYIIPLTFEVPENATYNESSSLNKTTKLLYPSDRMQINLSMDYIYCPDTMSVERCLEKVNKW